MTVRQIFELETPISQMGDVEEALLDWECPNPADEPGYDELQKRCRRLFIEDGE